MEGGDGRKDGSLVQDGSGNKDCVLGVGGMALSSDLGEGCCAMR